MNDNEFEPDTDFYIILKNPEGESGLGDPSITRVTIIDDDGKFMTKIWVSVSVITGRLRELTEK